MRVAQVNPSFDPAFHDPEALLAHYDTLVGWSEALLEAGASSSLVFQAFGRDLDLERHGVTYRFRSDTAPAFSPRWGRPRRLVSSVAAAAPDLAHLNGMIFPRAAGALRRALPAAAALVVQDHSGNPPARALGRGAGALSPLYRSWLGGVDAFLFTADAQAAPWQRAQLMRPAQPVHTVIEGSRRLRPLPRAAARAATGITGSPALLWVGRLNANKDPLTVLTGFEAAGLPASTLSMIHGSDELLPEVKARLAASPFLAERVRLLGAMAYDRMAAFFSAADLFVLGSHKEGSGYSLIEALACGAAPAVTDIPSFRAIAGSVGGLWAPDSAAELATLLRRLAGTDRETLRAEALAHFEAQLSWPAIGRRALAIYREVVDRRVARLR